MMSARVAPLNPIVFVLDMSSSDTEVPEYSDNAIVASTKSCISIAIQSYVDGETEIGITDDVQSISPKQMRVFAGNIRTPSKRVSVVTAELEEIVGLESGTADTFVDVWVDDRDSPARVTIGVKSSRGK